MHRLNCMLTLDFLSKVEFAGTPLCWNRPFLCRNFQCIAKCSISREKWSRLGLQELLLQSLERADVFGGAGSGVGNSLICGLLRKNGNMVTESHYLELTLTSQSCFNEE